MEGCLKSKLYERGFTLIHATFNCSVAKQIGLSVDVLITAQIHCAFSKKIAPVSKIACNFLYGPISSTFIRAGPLVLFINVCYS